jgi:hypothetical protein
MSKLSKVLEDLGEKYEINGEEFILKSLTGKNMGLFDKANKDDPEAPFKIVHASLLRTYDDIKYEEVLDVPLMHISKMVEVVMTASGFDVEKLREEVKE